MTLFSRLKSALGFGSDSRSVVHPFLRGEDLLGGAALASAFQQSAWVYACVTTLGENVSAIPFRILEQRGRTWEPANNRELLRLFEQPHPHMDRFAFWELIVSWLCLRGEAFVYPVHSSRFAVPSSLLVLNPDYLREIIVNGELAGWRYTATANCEPQTANGERLFLPDELIHIKLPNPFHFWRGMSPLTVAYVAAQTDYAAAQFMKGAMLNNADTGLIVTTKEMLSSEQREQLLAALRERKRAAGNADRPLFLWGDTHVEKPGISAVDLQFLDNRKWNRQEICAIFKVPQEVLGFSEDANRSVSEAARLNFIENRIAPLCKRLEAAIQPLLDGTVGGESSRATLRAEFHLAATPVMQAAQRARIDTAEKLFGLGVPLQHVNDVLQLSLPRVPHGQRTFLSTRFKELAGANVPNDSEQENDPTARLLTLLKGAGDCRTPKPVGETPLSRSKLSRALFEQRSRVLAALGQSTDLSDATTRIRTALNSV